MYICRLICIRPPSKSSGLPGQKFSNSNKGDRKNYILNYYHILFDFDQATSISLMMFIG